MERSNLICMLVGWYSATDHTMNADDLRIKIDNALMKSHFTPIGTEDNDLQLLDELLGETMMYVMGQGINRQQRRQKGIVKSK